MPAPAVVGGLSGSDGRLGGGPQAQSPSGVGDPGKNGALGLMASAASRGARRPIEVALGQHEGHESDGEVPVVGESPQKRGRA